MCVYVHMESKCLHLLLSTLCFEKGPLAEPETNSLYKLTGQKDPDRCHPWLANTGVAGMCHHSQHVTWMLVIGTQCFILTRQALCWQIYLFFLNWSLRNGMWGGKAVGVGSGEGRGCLILKRGLWREAFEEELSIPTAVPREHTPDIAWISFNFHSPTLYLHLTKVNLLL